MNPADQANALSPRDAATRVLDAFYLEGRVLPEGEYAPLREAMRRPAVLLPDCPDGQGHAMAVREFFARHDTDIVSLQQHRDQDMLLMRVEWQARGGQPCPATPGQRYGAVAQRLQAKWRIAARPRPPRIAIFVSRELHCLEDLLARHARGEIDCEIALIVANHADAQPLAVAHGTEES